MSFQLEILPNKGFNRLYFGSTQNDAVKAFGEPEETEDLKDPEFPEADSRVLHYWSHGFSLFFSAGNAGAFSSAEVDDDNVILFGEKVFLLSESDLIALFKKNGFSLSDSEVHDWGEKRISFDDAMVDVYYEKGKLRSINFGQLSSAPNYIFPN